MNFRRCMKPYHLKMCTRCGWQWSAAATMVVTRYSSCLCFELRCLVSIPNHHRKKENCLNSLHHSLRALLEKLECIFRCSACENGVLCSFYVAMFIVKAHSNWKITTWNPSIMRCDFCRTTSSCANSRNSAQHKSFRHSIENAIVTANGFVDDFALCKWTFCCEIWLDVCTHILFQLKFAN